MLTMAVEMLVCVGIIAWLLGQKRGEKFSANFVLKLILAGMIPVVIPIALDGFRPAAGGIPPLLYGFLMALFLAACVEELLIYLAFRVATHGSGEVRSVHDAVLAACVVNMGFVLLDDILYTVISASLLHAILLVHFIFGVAMGYFYGMAKLTGKFQYRVLAVCVPIAGHTLLDMWPYALRASAGAPAAAGTLSVIMMAVDALFAVLLVVAFALVVRWGKDAKLVSAPGEGGAEDGAAARKKGPAYANPESLDDYIRVTSPPVWATLVGMVVLVLGVFAWATLGELKTEVRAGALAEDGTLTCYVPSNYVAYFNESSTISVSGLTMRCNGAPVRTVTSGAEAKLLTEHGIDPASVAAVELSAPVEDGLYYATVVVETVSPLKLILG